MHRSTRVFSIVYFLALGAELFIETIKWDHQQLHLMVKGALMPLLLLLIITSLRGRKLWLTDYHRSLLLAVLLSWVGDLLLTKGADESYFIAGLGAFLLAQITYVITFIKAREENFEQLVLRKYPLSMIIPTAASISIFAVLRERLHEMFVPVMFYTLAITVMLLAAISRFRKTNPQSFWFVTIGAAVFMASDSLIAFNKFHSPITWADQWIMITYGIAQWLIVQGILREDQQNVL